MPLLIYQVDAFSDRPFGGNPAAVCVLDEPGSAAWMQLVAREMNLSETAFLEARDDGSFDLRWFTPNAEVDLCGHATLSSAHMLWEIGRLQPDAEARFHTRSGLLTAQRVGDQIEMDFPTLPLTDVAEPEPELRAALRDTPIVAVRKYRDDYVVELRDAASVRACRPDFAVMREHGFCVVITAVSDDPKFDFISRYFAAPYGIDEDPVTGSAHCKLGAYWQSRLGRSTFTAYQASDRGGVVGVEVRGERTLIRGQAITTLRAELSDAVVGASASGTTNRSPC